MNGLLIATPRQPVLTAVDAVERAGLKVARVDLSSFAMLRSIADEHLAVEAVIDLGADLTTIVIHNRGVPKLVRTLARGGRELTARLVDRMDLPEEVAEQAKYEIGLVESVRTPRSLAPSTKPSARCWPRFAARSTTSGRQATLGSNGSP